MGSANTKDKRRASVRNSGTYDKVPTQDRMKAIDQAMQIYFESRDWLSQRDRVFKGLSRWSAQDETTEQLYGEG